VSSQQHHCNSSSLHRTAPSRCRQLDQAMWLGLGICLQAATIYTHHCPIFLQCFDTVGWVIWPAKPVPNMTYNVFGGTLNLALSIYLFRLSIYLFSCTQPKSSDSRGMSRPRFGSEYVQPTPMAVHCSDFHNKHTTAYSGFQHLTLSQHAWSKGQL